MLVSSGGERVISNLHHNSVSVCLYSQKVCVFVLTFTLLPRSILSDGCAQNGEQDDNSNLHSRWLAGLMAIRRPQLFKSGQHVYKHARAMCRRDR